MFYALELFNIVYIVVCPDRLWHVERRRISAGDTNKFDPPRNLKLGTHNSTQL